MRRGAGVHSLKSIISLNQGSLNRVSGVHLSLNSTRRRYVVEMGRFSTIVIAG